MIRILSVLTLAGFSLAACGSAPHAVCKDEASASAYSIKWSDDLDAAMASGKLDRARGQEMQAEVNKLAVNRKPDNVSAFCTKLDELRKSGEF